MNTPDQGLVRRYEDLEAMKRNPSAQADMRA